MKRILLLEDDRALSQGICMTLQDDGVSLMPCFNLHVARLCLTHQQFDLAILDINLPDGNGLSLLSEIRDKGGPPVILLTANDLESDEVLGLELGAEDYITKPFSLAVLRARVGARLRVNAAAGGESVEIDDFSFDFSALHFLKNGVPVELSKTEQRLLYILVQNRGQTLTRNQLVERIWGEDAASVEDNALSVSIKRLRDKLEEHPQKPQYIKTVYGIGYLWAVKSVEH